MPTYTIIGATGKTGGSLLNLLLKKPNTTINAYVRSKSKLLAQVPRLEESKSVHIFEGSLMDVKLLKSCLSPNVDAVFCVLGVNENVPGYRVVQDASHAIVAALIQIRLEDPNAKIPKIIMLSSSSLNPRLHADKQAMVHGIVSRAFSNVYADLARAEDYLNLHKSWLDATFIQPGGLVEDEQKGHALSLDHQKSFLSYLDLAAGMIEVAESDSYKWEGVAVVPTGRDVKFEWKAPPQMARGLVWHFMPWLGGIMANLGAF